MRVRCFTVDDELHYAVTDILAVLGYIGAAQIHGRKKVLTDIAAGDITRVFNEVIGQGCREIMVITESAFGELMEDYPILSLYRESKAG